MNAYPGCRLSATIGALAALLYSTTSVLAADLTADLHVDRVTVYREGAIVTRTGQVEIPAGTHRLVIRGLPATIDAKALQVAVASPSVTLGSIEVEKINEGKFASEAEREFRRRIEETNDQRQVVQDDAATAQLQLKLLESLATNPAGSPTRATVDAANLGTVLTTMSTSSGAARRRVRESAQQLRTLDRTLEKLKADLAKVATQSKQSTQVRTSVEAAAPTTSIVSVSYTIADAGWEWIYEARLDTKQKRITLERQGQVQQGSGEDWKDVEVTLTTAIPSDDVATPVVGPLFLSLQDPLPLRTRVTAPRMTAALAEAPPPAAAEPDLREVVVTGGKRAARELSTDFLAEYRIPSRTTLLADRAPRLYPISNDTFDVTLIARVVPSASRAAHLEATFKYERDVPIESGSLQLYRDGAFVGEAETAVFLPGADVRMPFGADERIRVAAHDEQAQSAQRGVISRQLIKETRRRFDITNYHSTAVAVEIIDRVPVSKHSDVHVEILKGATEPSSKDIDGKAGVLMWKFIAEPQKLVSIRHFYSVQYPRDRRLEETEGSDE